MNYGIKEENIKWINYFKDTIESAKVDIINSNIIFLTGGFPDKMKLRLKEFSLVNDIEDFEGVIIGSIDIDPRFINDEVTIGEGNTDISGGEKLKLSLIRAFLKTPELLILDEPTSALDLENIKVLKELIVKGKSNRITIIITHDTKIMDIADEYVKLTKT